ncbi:unnamed protein product [Mytilus edulis]|uniref:BEN domain-containing protein n=1 Tax=Mytilus edulis TaxID=6550 RepID=A0A8S3U432_MYTED|nr:unnamed protein product [Mytilus edulis]
MVTGKSGLFNMNTNCEKKLRTFETKQDKLEQMLTAQRRQKTPGLLAIVTDDDSDDENPISEDMTITPDRLGTIEESAHSTGNFASLLYKEFMAHLFGQENIRKMYNLNGCGWMLKREVCPRTKLIVRQYVVHYYPECRKENTFRNVVVHKVNEALRRQSVNESLSPSSFRHSKSKLIC